MSGTTRTTDDEPCCEDVVVRDSVFNYNRRHGGSLDSLKGAIFERCVFMDSGSDINGGATDGDKGETYNGNLYGKGFDLEEYGEGTAFNDITFSDCDFCPMPAEHYRFMILVQH
ncbi:hypothetical protein PAT3040_02542 [Paenibacillus agaridevorans]|uniref:Uncharacterized protein n=1 Tax=Paenibacillus agaridevorans TaxID=171404 RepID=A0A2R5EN34_9BACL|nr:hypothetical protein PAT3040_02542 [Paenibacillus agaridevorans]